MNDSTKQKQTYNFASIDPDYLTDLYTAALQLQHDGYSVIPIWGDLQPGQGAKTPPIYTTKYQTEHATPAEFREWFLNKGLAGLAVFCGRISGNLLAIDFDTPEWVAQFQAAFPDLVNTRTHKSGGRGLPHYFYIAPVDVNFGFKGRKGAVELRGNGHYIIMPPTSIHGGAYKVTRGGEPLHLSHEQYARLLKWFDDNFHTSQHETADHESVPTGDANHLTAIFDKQVIKRNSRNEAAFVTLCIARDNGWTKEAARKALRAAFIKCNPNGEHRRETAGARGNEFDATLTSVYSRPPRKWLAMGIPTLLREHLLQHELVGLARVMDCLIMSGWQVGQRFTEAEAVGQCGQHGISRPTVHAALQITVETMQGVMVSDDPSTDTSDTLETSLTLVSSLNLDVMGVNSNTPALVFNAKDSVHFDYIQIRGKSVKVFTLPDVREWCKSLHITVLFSDAIPFEALVTAGSYRAAITKALIARKPQKYKQALLAKRVGIKRHGMMKILKRDKSIISTPCYAESQITIDNLETLPVDNSDELMDSRWGQWLEVEGKKYPPIREIAQRYLNNGYTVTLIKREANHYAVEATTDSEPTAEPQPTAEAQSTVIIEETFTPATPADEFKQWAAQQAEALGGELIELGQENGLKARVARNKGSSNG
jgi:hypothetical protein